VSARRAFRAAGRAASVAVLLAASGCSVTNLFSEMTRVDYKSATRGPALDVPPDLVSPRTDERAGNAGPTTFSSFDRDRAVPERRTASGPGVLPQPAGVRLERQGTQRWLVVDQPPEKVWPLLREFWTQAGFALRTESPETGIMETDWTEKRFGAPDSGYRNLLSRALGSLYSTGERDKFRTRIESDGKVTEVFVSHRGLVEELTGVQKDATVWTQRPSDPELEAEFLRRMMLRLQGQPQRASAAPAAAAASAPAAPASAEPAPPPRATVVQADGRPALQMTDGFDRSWRQVGLALDRGGFTVEDRDRSRGTYFVRYVDPDQETRTPGLIDRVFGTSTSGKDLSGRRYRIVVADAGAAGGTRVGVLGEDGSPPSSDADRRIAGRIVDLLRDQLR